MATSRSLSHDVRLRPGGHDDLDEVMRIMTAAFDPCFGEAWTRTQCAGILPLQGVGLTIAEGDEGPCGFALVRRVADEAELLLLAVSPSKQRCGVGRALLRHFIDSARADGASRLHLEVRDGNPANALYLAHGFHPAGRRMAYYRGLGGERFDAITLVLHGEA